MIKDFFLGIIASYSYYVYYLLEAIITGFILYIIWNIYISDNIGIHLTYANWILIFWIFKVLNFDIFKVNTSTYNNINNNEEENI